MGHPRYSLDGSCLRFLDSGGNGSLQFHPLYNLDVIETGYGISLRPLSVFANEVYKNCYTHCFKVKLTGDDADSYTEKDKLLVSDGGFSRTYQKTSGIAGYALLFSSRYLRMVSHQPFAGREEALKRNHDIDNDNAIFETLEEHMKVAQTDEGIDLQAQVDDLVRLMEAYRSGAVAENH